ncbi:GvpL/GvpF family gas vesicle protein [bacterium]|nr:GvpL/GvpF family gas vesicle protein [bacterium]
MEYGKYIYCIIDADENVYFGPIGIGENKPVVTTVNYKDIAAVVSTTPIKKYRVSRENSVAHEFVVEAAMEDYTILPVRFGTIAKNEILIQAVLERRYSEFKDTLSQMKGKVELGVKVTWREDVIFEEIVNENEDIRALKDEIAASSLPPEQTHWERARVGEMVELAMDSKREEEAANILQRLKPYCVDFRENRVLLDRMILNAAFLVDKSREEEFDKQVKTLDAEQEDRLIIKYVGPIVPYNFVDIVIDIAELGLE